VEAVDLSDGCGSKFSVIVVHDGFEGKCLLDRQRSVNDCLKEEMKQIHALQMKTWTRVQYEQKTGKTIDGQSPGEN
jgi:stress-induced morphogen